MTVADLIAAGIAPTQAKAFACPLQAACEEFGINTPRSQAAFIAQLAHESQGFTRLEENLYYTTPARIRAVFPSSVRTVEQARWLAGKPQELANCVYAGRLGNGDEASGDGWRYRGRGLIQLTGRHNYKRAADALRLPLIERPDLAAEPKVAARIAGWYWHSHQLNRRAEAGDIDGITAAINGPAALGADERRRITARLLRVLGEAPTSVA